MERPGSETQVVDRLLPAPGRKDHVVAAAAASLASTALLPQSPAAGFGPWNGAWPVIVVILIEGGVETEARGKLKGPRQEVRMLDARREASEERTSEAVSRERAAPRTAAHSGA